LGTGLRQEQLGKAGTKLRMMMLQTINGTPNEKAVKLLEPMLMRTNPVSFYHQLVLRFPLFPNAKVNNPAT